jgi:hypothetical protein
MEEHNEAAEQLFEITDLPQPDWDARWDHIVMPEEDRRVLSNYGELAGSLDTAGIVGWGLYKTVGFIGPPGTGKTTLAMRYANELAGPWERANHQGTKLLQLHAEALFSHFLGATGKNIGRLFDTIRWLAQRANLVILIDEVESLALSRKAVTANPNEPSDLMRGVNTLIAELDRIRYQPRLVVIWTSNLAEVLDEALVSRTDLIIPFALPDVDSRGQIIGLRLKKLERWLTPLSSEQIAQLAALSEGCSGRELARLPFQAVIRGGKQPDQLEFADYLGALEAMKAQAIGPGKTETAAARNRTTEQLDPAPCLRPDDRADGGAQRMAAADAGTSAAEKSLVLGSTTGEMIGAQSGEAEVLERRLNLGGTRLPTEAAHILINTLVRLARLVAFPAAKELEEALEQHLPEALALLLAAQIVEQVEVYFAGEMLRITPEYFPVESGRRDDLDLSAISYAGIQAEQVEVRFQVTDPNFGEILGGNPFNNIRVPGLKLSVVLSNTQCSEALPQLKGGSSSWAC